MDLISYRVYYLKSQIEEIVDILKDKRIEYAISEEVENSDSLFPKNKFNPKYTLQIKQEDFTTVDNILLEISNKQLNNVDNNHYLFGFSNDELYEIVSEKNKWSDFDFLLAKEILTKRGLTIDESKLKHLVLNKSKTINKEEFTEISNTTIVFLGIIGLLIIMTVWYLTNITISILTSLLVVAIIYFIYNSFIKRLKYITCPNCGQYIKTELLSREENSNMLVPENLKDLIAVSYKFQCADCNHVWYKTNYEQNPYSVNG